MISARKEAGGEYAPRIGGGGSPLEQVKDVPGPGSLLYQLPGKTDGKHNAWLPLWVHLSDTTGVMKRLMEHWLPGSLKRAMCRTYAAGLLEPLCTFLALTHDLGKMTPVMARKMLGEGTEEIEERIARSGVSLPGRREFGADFNSSPHALAGQVILLKHGCPKSLAVVIGSHHGMPERMDGDSCLQLECYPRNYGTACAGGAWEGLWASWLKDSLEASGFASMSELPDPGRPEQMLLTGLLIMADWIASNEAYFPLIPAGEDGYGISPEERAEEGWERLGLPGPWKAEKHLPAREAFLRSYGFCPNAIQEAVTEAVEGSPSPGLVILEAPMGSGKTEAALAAAEILALKEGCGGLFFGLPTQATANGIFPRLEEWAKGQSADTVHAIRLAHGRAELNDDYRALFKGSPGAEEGPAEEGLIVHEWFKGRKQALLSEFAVGTVDQLLMAALKQRHVMLRHLGLAGKVVVIDEVHSYDAYMSQYLDRALNWLGRYGTPVIMLSATLPDKRREEMVGAYLGGKAEGLRQECAYPLLTWTDGGSVRQKSLPPASRSVSVRIERRTDEEAVCLLREKLARGGCAGVILNTVRRAQEFTAKIKEDLPGKEVLLLHSGFVATDRAEKEKAVLSRAGKSSTARDRDGLIIVGTQVLEQSLDIDFDLLVTDLCPMDLLLQRIGRLHRHDRSRPQGLEEAVCIVLGSEGRLEPGSEKIYGRWLLQRTSALMPDRIVLPEMISGLVRDAYAEAAPETLSDALSEAWEEHVREVKKKKAKADAFRLMKPEKRGGPNGSFTIRGLLDADYNSGETDGIRDARAQAMVRDGEPSLEVLVMVRHDDGRVGFLPWQYRGAEVDTDRPPSEEVSIRIAGQRLRLPGALCRPSVRDRTISWLEDMDRQYLAQWQRSHMLRGELVLLLDERLDARINDCVLHYDKELGLFSAFPA